MNTGMKLITALAIVSTTVAVVEGVLLVRASDREPTVTQSPATGDPAAIAAAGKTPVANGRSDGAEPADVSPTADVATGAAHGDSQTTAGAPPMSADGTANPDAAADLAAASPPLSDKEKARQEKAAAMAKLEEAMVSMADQNIKQLIARLALDEIQQQATAETVEKLREEMLNMILTPTRMGKDLENRAQEMRQEALLQGLTEAEIAEQLKAEQLRLMTDIRQHMTSSLTRFSSTLDEMRTVLNPVQTQTLDQMQTEIKQQQAMMDRMMNAMTEEQSKATGDTPAP